MRLIPTKAWIKEAIPSYLCCETSPWASLWVRLYVWLCPDCRKEYESMKDVWMELDNWQVDSPPDILEDQFCQTLRAKYPSAFDSAREAVAPRAADLLLRLAYTSAIVALGTLVLFTHEEPSRQPMKVVSMPKARITQPQQPAVASAAALNPTTEALNVSQADPRQNERVASQAPVRPNVNDLLADEWKAPRGVQVRTVSLDNARVSAQSRPNLSGLKRTIQVNNYSVSGFDTLFTPNNDRSF